MPQVEGPVFGIVAGEVSGDTLGAGLIRALKQHYPHARFIGIAGPQMMAEGAESLVPMDRLSVMGLVEVLGRLRELFRVRDDLINTFTEVGIDAFIGIDAPDFNLRVAAQLKQCGITTVHYVSPSVWAWRQGRVHGIRASIDLMLCLLPFEKAFYDKHQVKAVFVGHPLADSLPMQTDMMLARAQLGLNSQTKIIGLLPGSRRGEVASLMPLLLATARLIYQSMPAMQFVVPAINAERAGEIAALISADAEGKTVLPLQILKDEGQSTIGRQVMSAADVLVMASGTATLEAMLIKRPMVVSYRLHWLTWLIARLLVRIPYVSLPNLLAGRALVPELLQYQATPDNIARETLAWLQSADRVEQFQHDCVQLHQQLKQDASATAAGAIIDLLQAKTLDKSDDES